MKVSDTESSDDDYLVLDESDKLKSLLINEYVKVLGSDYINVILKRIDYIVKEFKEKKVFSYDNVVEKSGRSR